MKQWNYFILQTLLFVSVALSSACQSSNTFPGVYAGVKLSLNPLGGGMNRTDVVILFRKDKTFTDELEKKDWKTAVRGKYVISGKKIQLLYKNGDKDEFDMTSHGNLDAGTFVMFKMELDNRVPKGSYKFKFVSGAGGIATGTTYIGSSSNRELNFDGAGNFTTERQSATVVAGDNIGGGTSSKSDGRGKYTLTDGALTLKYDNGNTTTHSFFASAGDSKNKPMAVVDGSFYFMEDDKGNKTESKNSTSSRTGSTQNTSAPNSNSPGALSGKLPTAVELLSSLRNKYGAEAIDGIRTYKVTAEFNGIKLVSYNDLAGNRFRNEMYQKGKLVVVEQISATSGWQWVNGKKTPATAARIREAQYNDYVGVLGLQQKYNKAFAQGKVMANKKGYSVGFQVDGNTFIYVIDKDYNIVGDSYVIGKNKQINAYSNNRTIAGIRLPFTTISSNGTNKITINYQSFEANGTLDTDWSDPR
ncbi:hypothetical protein PBAL39_14654 [Pedobacter sp. BAL39]|uniref:hypothetical protein n=1 Tax=Pedobacter sp. BAL39 TaxID=391596 RepID=UPI00015595D2|nr:hypothetical protein [Pedobacter sp. BAL39]EDM37674.1 hypothetical protein PBAL39_14654 [Pedobacter sp. BAL39]